LTFADAAPQKPAAGFGAGDSAAAAGAGLSQEKVARRSGLHLTWINRVENGHANPTWGSIKRVAAALAVSLGELATLAEEKDRER
jgi:transcriptional regulator with XRE-family HTH domain